MPTVPRPKVSILTVTYNHESFIAATIDSVLMQQTTFDYEMVIGEDCSTDGTRAIVMDYAARHPNRIRALLHERNMGAQENFRRTLRACRGEYIAVLDGDDYWISAEKLQKQADFLDAHPECVLSFHNVLRIDASGKGKTDIFPGCERRLYDLSDILVQNPIPTASAMFRGGLVTDLPAWVATLVMSDRPLWVLLARHGKIGFLNEVMSAYRMHGGGVWSHRNAASQHENQVRFLEFIDAELDFQFQDLIRPRLYEVRYNAAVSHWRDGRLDDARRYTHACWDAIPAWRHPLKNAILMARIAFPKSFGVLRSLSRRLRGITA